MKNTRISNQENKWVEFYIWRVVRIQIWLFSTPMLHVSNFVLNFYYSYLKDKESFIYLLSYIFWSMVKK